MVTNKKKKYNHEWYLQNKERLNARSRKDYTDNKKEWKERSSKRYYAHREELIEQAKRWAKKNTEKVREAKRKWKRNNRFKCNVEQQTMSKYGPITEKCVLCGHPGESRHHNTEPYHVDKFITLCQACHGKIHRRRKT